MYSVKENNFFNNRPFIGFIGESRDLSSIITDLNEIKLKPNWKVKNIIDNLESLKVLGFSNEILKKKIKDLSYSEYKLVLLVRTCELKPNIVILNNLDLGLNHKIKSNISKYIKMVNANSKVNFIVISNDILFINRIAKHLIVSKNKIIKYQGDVLTAIKQGLVPKPPIIEFIDMANKSNAKLDYTLDNKELLKAIYRSVF